MRRYQLPYQVVGGFSFYERAEIKDIISLFESGSESQTIPSLFSASSTRQRAASAKPP